MPFGDDAIAVVTDGLRRSTGSFGERLVSHGLIGDILTSGATGIANTFAILQRGFRKIISWVV
jgi:hypothetical protein